MFPKGFSEEPPETHHTRFKNDFWQSSQTLQYHKRSTDSQLKKYRAHLSKWRIFRTAITETASRIGINSNVEKQIWNWIELLQKFIAVESHSVQGGSRSHQKIRSQHYWKHPPRILKTQSPLNLNFSGLFYTHKIISLLSNLKLLGDCWAFSNSRINGIVLKKEAMQAKFFIITDLWTFTEPRPKILP